MDYDPQFNESRVVAEAVRQATIPGAPSRLSNAARGASVAPPQGFTVPIIGENGAILDGHDALWDLDMWDDVAAFWAP